MTHPTTTSPAPESEIPDHPTDILLDLITTVLAPLFLFGADGNIAHARLAALETVNAYRIETQADLIAVAQIVAFGFAALASLSQSMDEDLSPSLALRLRNTANACSRSAEQNRRTLGTHRTASRPARPSKPAQAATPSGREAQASVPPAPKTSRQPAPRPAQPDQQTQWFQAAAAVAAEYAANPASLSPGNPAEARFKAALLGSCANELLNQSAMKPPPAPRPTGATPRHPPGA